MSDRKKKLRRIARRGWVTIFGSVGGSWVHRAKLPRQDVGEDLYVPPWVKELYLHLLPDEPPAVEEHFASMFALGRALLSGALAEDTVAAAFRLGGPEAVVALARGMV